MCHDSFLGCAATASLIDLESITMGLISQKVSFIVPLDQVQHTTKNVTVSKRYLESTGAFSTRFSATTPPDVIQHARGEGTEARVEKGTATASIISAAASHRKARLLGNRSAMDS